MLLNYFISFISGALFLHLISKYLKSLDIKTKTIIKFYGYEILIALSTLNKACTLEEIRTYLVQVRKIPVSRYLLDEVTLKLVNCHVISVKDDKYSFKALAGPTPNNLSEAYFI